MFSIDATNEMFCQLEPRKAFITSMVFYPPYIANKMEYFIF